MKNLNKSILLWILTIFCVAQALAQVSFTNMGNSLGSISGSSYEDCAVDMNGDHLDDIVRVTNNRIYIDYQQADGSFSQTEFTVSMQNSPSWSICAGDIDGNGFTDLLFGGGSRVSFMYASDDGTTFTEDYHDAYIFSQRSTFADIDNDGHLDAFVCHDVDQSHPYRNDGNGVLTEDQSLIQTLDLAGNYAAIWVDYDNDWDTDLYITKCRQGSSPGDIERTNAMYRNNGDGTYTEVGAEIGMADNAQSWATSFEDYDNDGDFDAFIVNHDFQNRFMENDGNGNFTDIIETTNIAANDLGAWENASGDFNNDGFVDIFSELARELYINNGNMTFTGYDLPFNDGGIGDFNNDGFLDVVNGNAVWVNDGNDNNWVKVNTEGIFSNKDGIGSRVEIYGEWGIQIREVRAGQSFSPMSSLTVHFGLGTATEIDSLIVKWPSGALTKLDNPEINTTHNIPETNCLLGESTLTVNGDTELCPGESLEISAPDGFAIYQWSNGATTQSIQVEQPGNYNVILEDAEACISLSNTVTVSFIEETYPTISVDGDDLFCFGESVVLSTDSDANPVWSNGQSGQSITVTETGSYFVQTEAICSDDPLSSETINVVVLNPQNPVVEDAILNTPGPATITATGNNLQWYDSPSGGNLIGMGSTFAIDFLEMDSTVYVESHEISSGGVQEGGKPDNSGGGGLPNSGGYSFFDAWEPFTISKVTVYVPNNAPAGERDIQLFDEFDNLLTETTVDLVLGEQEIDLDFEVPAGTGYSLRCPQNNLFRNNSGVNYPYPIGNLGELTSSLFGTGYYYYFYNWKVEKDKVDCVSERVEANARIIVSTNEITGTLTQLSVYPNPAQELVNIEFEALQNSELWIRIYDITGKEVTAAREISMSTGKHIETLNVENFPKGIYNIQLSSNGQSVSQKVVVQ